MTRRRRATGLLAPTLVAAGLVALLSLGYRSLGPALLRHLAERRGLDASAQAELLLRGDVLHQAFVAAALALLALWGLLALVLSGRLRPWLALLLLLPVYLGIERWASPHLAVPLGLLDYYAVRDPDHRPLRADSRAGYNADAVRSRHAPEDFGPDGFNVVFLGDSFTAGHRLTLRESFPDKVERRLGRARADLEVRVANFAWVSASPLLAYRRLRDLGDRYHPDLVVLCVDMTDFRDDILWRNMLERRGIYRLYDEIPLTLKALQVVTPGLHRRLYTWSGIDMPEARFFHSQQPLEASRAHLAPLVENLAKIRAWCRERNIPFVVFVLPRTYQYSERESPENWEADQYTVLGPHSLEPFRFFDELETQVDYPIHSLLPTFQRTEVFPTSFDDDPHWNGAGASVAAEEIGRILEAAIATLRPQRGRSETSAKSSSS